MEVTLCKQFSSNASGCCSVSVVESRGGAPTHDIWAALEHLESRSIWRTSSTATQSLPFHREDRWVSSCGGLGRPFSSHHGHPLQHLDKVGCRNAWQMWHMESMCHCSLCKASYLLCALTVEYQTTKDDDSASFLLYSFVGKNFWQWGKKNAIKSKMWGTSPFLAFFRWYERVGKG